MYTIVKLELIKQFLTYYDIDYDLLSIDVQALVCILSNIFVVLFFFIIFYIVYRLLKKFFSFIF